MKDLALKLGMPCFVASALAATISGATAGTFQHITIDGSLDDWTGVPLAYSQAQDVTNAIAYKNIYVANDEDYLYIRFGIYGSDNPFTSTQNIFIDTDDNAATGFNAHDQVHSELLIQAGNGYQEKNGAFNEGGINGLDWLAAPGSGSDFELRISRNATYASDGTPVFSNNTIHFVLEAETTGFTAVEWVPSTVEGVTYTFASPTNIISTELVTNSYTISTDEFANPERGFYIQSDSYASSPSAIPSNLASYRVNGKNSPGNTYTADISLLLRVYYLDTFVSAPISSNFLNSIQTDFNSLRSQGVKAIVRFAYTQNQTRPFGEPSKAQILAHISQLSPVLTKNADVIATVQEGLIGAWGEGYFTDIFYTNGQATRQNWLDRNDVVSALLAALPSNRMIQVRTPQMKQKYVSGPTASTSVAPMSSTNAFSGSDAARIGFHNDCYLADSTDEGTFSAYDVGAATTQTVITNLRNYLAQDTRFTPMGGETCAVNPPTDDCAAVGGNADPDMAFAHYSFLNEGYNASVNNLWATHGCMDDIKRRLGYRFELLSSIAPAEAQPGQVIPLTLTFTNLGFAAPYNPRGMELVLRNTATGQKFFAELSRDTDIRRWLPGANYVVGAQLSLPSNIPLGNYDLLLNLPDPAPSLYAIIPYSIRLANSNAVSSSGTVLGNVWEPATGYHRLYQTLTINSTATNSPASGQVIPVLNYSAVAETFAIWKARNFPAQPGAGDPGADADGDGRINLLEYAVGSNPNVPDTGSYMSLSVTNDIFFLSVQKGPGVKDVNYEVESSPDLAAGNWSNSSVTVLQNDASTFRASYSGMATSGFLRLKLSLQ